MRLGPGGGTADTTVSKTVAARCAGSNPAPGTMKPQAAPPLGSRFSLEILGVGRLAECFAVVATPCDHRKTRPVPATQKMPAPATQETPPNVGKGPWLVRASLLPVFVQQTPRNRLRNLPLSRLAALCPEITRENVLLAGAKQPARPILAPQTSISRSLLHENTIIENTAHRSLPVQPPFRHLPRCSPLI